jgi:hypothetical protein
MTEEQGFYKLTDNVQQAYLFRDRVKGLLSWNPSIESDEDAIIKLQEVIKNNTKLHDFWLKVMNLVGVDLSDENLSDDATIDILYEMRCERAYYRQILDHLCNRLKLYGANAFEELKNIEVREADETPRAIDQIAIEKLKKELRIAQKTIARLVGE